MDVAMLKNIFCLMMYTVYNNHAILFFENVSFAKVGWVFWGSGYGSRYRLWVGNILPLVSAGIPLSEEPLLTCNGIDNISL